MGRSTRRNGEASGKTKEPTNGSDKSGERNSRRDAIGNESKQRSVKSNNANKAVGKVNDEHPNDGKKSAMSTKHGKAKQSGETSINFTEGDIEMSMAVTDEENRIFKDSECEITATSSDGTMHDESSESEDELNKQMGKNNNASVGNKTYSKDDASSAKRAKQWSPSPMDLDAECRHVLKQRETAPDDEEVKFMERFAVFMEQRGFVQWVAKPVRAEDMEHEQPIKTKGAKRKLDMSQPR